MTIIWILGNTLEFYHTHTHHVHSAILDLLPVLERVLGQRIADVAANLELVLRQLNDLGRQRADCRGDHGNVLRQLLEAIERQQRLDGDP